MRVCNTIFITSVVILFSLSGVAIIYSEIPTASGQTYTIQANNDFATTYQGLPSTIDVLLNDYDPNPSAIMNVVIDSQPLHGSVVYDPKTQLVTYTSSPDYYGPDFFTYHVDDGISISNIAQVNITVIQIVVPNSPPVAVSDTYTTNAGTPIILNVLANDYDPDGDPLTIVSVTGPYHGTISIQQDQTI
ncbi:MAG TPA: Ig-like domain-containing protein, partial [Candidatus Acidoferrum sp.]|nr:Ig-like domain-containing protein [Candidatus Acidoferrum sp.]